MDLLNEKIISFLKIDGRISNANIARSLNVSEGTIRRRIKKLIDEGVITVYASPDPEKAGYFFEALVGIQVLPGQLDQAAEEIAKYEQTTWVSRTTGSFDIFAWVTLRSSEDLGEFLSQELGSIEGVNKTETFVNLKVLKRGFGP
ncbi:MAG: Lrp/AsnC family transcriptional regulator [Chloroflexota bacterium]